MEKDSALCKWTLVEVQKGISSFFTRKTKVEQISQESWNWRYCIVLLKGKGEIRNNWKLGKSY